MKFTQVAFLTILIAFLFVCVSAQGTTLKNLKVSLQIKEKELCVGKPFTILARLENVGETTQLIDESKLWRSVDILGPIENTLFDKNNAENPSKNPEFPNWNSGMSLLKRENWNFVKLKPKDFYEDVRIFDASDKSFNQPGRYLYQVGYWQFSDSSSNKVSTSEDIIRSNELEFTLKVCK